MTITMMQYLENNATKRSQAVDQVKTSSRKGRAEMCQVASVSLPFLCFLSCSTMVAISHSLSVRITASSVGSPNSFHTLLLCLLAPKRNMDSFCFPGSRKKHRKDLQGSTSLANAGFLEAEDQNELAVLHQSLSKKR